MADTKISALTAAAAAAANNEFAINEAGISKKVSLTQIATYISELLFTRINGSSGAAGEYKTTQKLSANAAANATVTLATVMTTTGLSVGTWHFRYNIIYQAAATTTGVDFAIGFSGTGGSFVATSRFTTSGGSAANAIGNDIGSNTANLMEGKAQRTLGGKMGSTLGVVTANVNQHYTIEGTLVVTVTGNLTLQHCSELAASTQVMADSTLELTKIG